MTFSPLSERSIPSSSSRFRVMVSFISLAFLCLFVLNATPAQARELPTFSDLAQCQYDCYRICSHEKATEQSIEQLKDEISSLISSPAYKAESGARRKKSTSFVPIEEELDAMTSPDELTTFARETYLRSQLEMAQSQHASMSSWREWSVTLLGWDCEENCRYDCMHLDNANRISSNREIVKYKGKWPFLRVFGTQEFFSSLFSALNIIPHAIYFFRWRKNAPVGHYMNPIMVGYSISAVHTWIWSTIFHARDNWFTHNMDYFFATFSLMYMAFFTVVRLVGIRSSTKQLFVSGPLFAYFIFHVYYMLYVEWDYDYNMILAVTLGIIFCGGWTVYGGFQYFTGRKPYALKVFLSGLVIAFFAGFEVFDFPPIGGLLDAHAIWHGATPLASYFIWVFLLEDVQKDGYASVKQTRQD